MGKFLLLASCGERQPGYFPDDARPVTMNMMDGARRFPSAHFDKVGFGEVPAHLRGRQRLNELLRGRIFIRGKMRGDEAVQTFVREFLQRQVQQLQSDMS